MTATGLQTFPRTAILMTQDNIPIPIEMARSRLTKTMEGAEENFQWCGYRLKDWVPRQKIIITRSTAVIKVKWSRVERAENSQEAK